MSDIDALFEGEGKNLTPELRILLTQAWVAGFQSGFHAGFDEAGEITDRAMKQVTESLIKVMGNEINKEELQ